MKKFAKVLALSLALVMALGMTAFASELSPGSGNGGATGKDPSVKEVESLLPSDSKFTIAEARKLTDAEDKDLSTKKAAQEEAILKSYSSSSGSATSKVSKVTLEEVFRFELSGNAADIEGNRVKLMWPKDLAAGQYVALHLSKTGWITHTVTFEGDYMYLEGVKDFSPFVIYKVNTTVTPVNDSTPSNSTPNNNTTNDNTTTTSTTPTTPLSPKTGETLPVAAVIALLAFACAAVVGAKKVIAER